MSGPTLWLLQSSVETFSPWIKKTVHDILFMYPGNVFLNKEVESSAVGNACVLSLSWVLMALPSSQAGQHLPVGRVLPLEAKHVHLRCFLHPNTVVHVYHGGACKPREPACHPPSSQKSSNLRWFFSLQHICYFPSNFIEWDPYTFSWSWT